MTFRARGSGPPFPTIAWVATRSRVPPALLHQSDHPSLRNGIYHPSLCDEKHGQSLKSHSSPAIRHYDNSIQSPPETSPPPMSLSPHLAEDGNISVLNLQEAITPQKGAQDEHEARPFSSLVVELALTVRDRCNRLRNRGHNAEDNKFDTRVAKRRRLN